MRKLWLLILGFFFFGCIIKKNNYTSKHIIAHRGAWKKLGLPENSIASLQQAIKIGCYGSEFDVHMTLDSILVVNHDAEFLGIKIETSTYQQLLQKKLPNQETIPTLEAYLKEGLKQTRTKLILEIKTSVISKERTLSLTKKVVETVKRLNAQSIVEYISFDFDACEKVIELDPAAKVSYLKGDKDPAKLKANRFYGLDYHYSVFEKNPTWLTDSRKVGLVTNSWTVNDEKTANWLFKNKVNYITTNEPELLMELEHKY